MESLEIFQDETACGWWVVAHNGNEIYRSDALSGVVSWLRGYSQFKDWETITLYLQPRARG